MIIPRTNKTGRRTNHVVDFDNTPAVALWQEHPRTYPLPEWRPAHRPIAYLPQGPLLPPTPIVRKLPS